MPVFGKSLLSRKANAPITSRCDPKYVSQGSFVHRSRGPVTPALWYSGKKDSNFVRYCVNAL
jgi:hypothetical protein